MKQINKILFFLLIFIISSQNNYYSKDNVYVCLGNYAYAYHSDINCFRLNYCKKNIIVMRYNKAKSNNRIGCSQCCLPTFKQTNTSTYSLTNNSKTISMQCQASTKKGTQCSRKAKYGNYCYQHY